MLRGMDSLTLLTLFGIAFTASHLGLPHPPLRSALRARLGENGYLSLYSLISFGTLLPLLYLWWGARHQGPLLWSLRSPAMTHVAELLVVLGFALMLAGAVRPAPSSIASRMQNRPIRVQGLNRVTRHPVSMGIMLWALAHLLVNGWASDVVFFGSMLLTALLGALHQDARKSVDPAYAELRARTSVLPDPRGLLGLDWVSALALLAGAAGAVVLRVFHSQLFSG